MSAYNELWMDINALAQTVVLAIKAVLFVCLFVYSANNNCQLVAKRYYIASTQAFTNATSLVLSSCDNHSLQSSDCFSPIT